MELKKYIREVPDFPKKGILFYDITTLLQDKDAFKFCIDSLYDLVKNKKYDKVVAIESRGFIFASALALKLNAGFVILRKPGKLPYKTIQESYDLEYGKNVLEMHIDALKKNEKILLVDDLLATGGTISAAINLVEKSNAKVEDILFVIELEFLKGREKLKNYNVKSLIKY
ncbi:MAG: adenine phosphoribosyltransferase [Candidatus Woesearchaeota archaeon]